MTELSRYTAAYTTVTFTVLRDILSKSTTAAIELQLAGSPVLYRHRGTCPVVRCRQTEIVSGGCGAHLGPGPV